MKFKNRLKQYGLVNTVVSILSLIIRPLVQFRTFIVLAYQEVPKSKGQQQIITVDKAKQWHLDGSISEKDFNTFIKFLDDDCTGYFIEVNKKIAAWGFIQNSGIYQYAGNQLYKLPKNVNILKNLYVKPQYRGQSLGKKINQIRLKAIGIENTPIVFVVSNNRYALRNLKILGFNEYVIIKHTKWFNKINKRKINVLNSHKFSKQILKGFGIGEIKK